jgi:phosphatidylserine decarboxylase
MWVIRVILKFNENEGINVMVLPVSPDCVRSIQVELPL